MQGCNRCAHLLPASHCVRARWGLVPPRGNGRRCGSDPWDRGKARLVGEGTVRWGGHVRWGRGARFISDQALSKSPMVQIKTGLAGFWVGGRDLWIFARPSATRVSPQKALSVPSLGGSAPRALPREPGNRALPNEPCPPYPTGRYHTSDRSPARERAPTAPSNIVTRAINGRTDYSPGGRGESHSWRADRGESLVRGRMRQSGSCRAEGVRVLRAGPKG